MAQMNPLIGPILPQKALFAIQTYWVSTRLGIFLKKIKISVIRANEWLYPAKPDLRLSLKVGTSFTSRVTFRANND